MSQGDDELYPVLEIQQNWVLQPEALGSKIKFWYAESNDAPLWLFKYPQTGTGQHWAEKIAAEVAEAIDVLHARVELAVFQGARGSATESFARKGRELYHGNQVVARHVLGYDPDVDFRQSDHTLENIYRALDGTFVTDYGRRRAKARLADYFVFDALIGNTDRHHENWGILYKQTKAVWTASWHPLSIMHRRSVVSCWMTGVAASCLSNRSADIRKERAAPFSGHGRMLMRQVRWSWSGAEPHCILTFFGYRLNRFGTLSVARLRGSFGEYRLTGCPRWRGPLLSSSCAITWMN